MKRSGKIYIIALFLCGGMLNARAQQTPVFSQYAINKFLVNPAVAGGNGISTVNMVAREQFVGFENAPRTFALSAQTRLLDNSYIRRALRIRKNANQATRIANVGLGANVYSDRNGIVSRTGLQISYAYHINFNNKFQLSMGLSGTVFQYKLDYSDTYRHDTNDPLLLGNKTSFWVPDATTGVYVTTNRLYGGFSLTDLFGSSVKLGKDPISGNYRTARNFNIIGGYKISLDDNFMIEPSFLMRATKFDFLTDLSARLFYQDQYWLGVAYRTNRTVIAMFGASVDMFYFGYAFDASLGSMSNYNSGSHELMLGLRFGDNSVRRFRWIKKDESDFDM